MPPSKNMIDRKVRMSQEDLRAVETGANRAGLSVPKYMLNASLAVAADVPPENAEQAVSALSADLDPVVLQRIKNCAEEEELTIPQYWQASVVTQATDVHDPEEASQEPEEKHNPLQGTSPERAKRIQDAALGLDLTVEEFLIEAALMTIHVRERNMRQGRQPRGPR